jgi:hypothetical protein
MPKEPDPVWEFYEMRTPEEKFPTLVKQNRETSKLSMPIRKGSHKEKVWQVIINSPKYDATINEIRYKTRLKLIQIYSSKRDLVKDMQKCGLNKYYKLDINEKKNGYKIYVLAS